MNAKEYYEEMRKAGLTEDITSNDEPDYKHPFYQNIFRLMEGFSQKRKITPVTEFDLLLDEMENSLTDFIDDDFKKATAPAIRFLFKNHDPHTKIYIDYSSAELLQGRRCCNLNDEIPD